MKNLLLFSTIALFLTASCTKEIFEPNPTTNESWKEKGLKIVMLGDSETRRINHYWGADTNWTSLMEYDSIFNYGYDAFSSGMILTEWGNESPVYQALGKNPDVIFLMIGINDAHHNVPESVTFQNIQILIDTIRNRGVDLVIQSVLPTTNWYDTTYGGFPQNGILASRAASLNIGIQLICQQNNIPFLELRTGMITEQTAEDPAYLLNELSVDGIHLNYSGYTEWKKELTKYLENNY